MLRLKVLVNETEKNFYASTQEQIDLLIQTELIEHPEVYPTGLYSYTIEDVTEQRLQQQQIENQIKQAQLAAAARLESFDSEIDSASDLESLKAKIKTFVMDVAVLLK